MADRRPGDPSGVGTSTPTPVPLSGAVPISLQEGGNAEHAASAAAPIQSASVFAMCDTALNRAQDERFAAYLPPLEAAHRRRGRHSSRLLLIALCCTFFLLIIWAAFADLDETVVGTGQVITSQRVQHIQNLEGGILREVLVAEGEQVEKGALLLRIDNEQAGSVYRDAVTRSLELSAVLARIDAELHGTDPKYPDDILAKAPEIATRHTMLLEARRQKADNERKTLEAQIELKDLEEKELLARRKSLEEGLVLATRQRDMAKKLMATRSYSEMEYLNLARNVSQLAGELEILKSSIPKTRAAVREAEEKLRLHASETQTRLLQERNEAAVEYASLQEGLIAGADRVTRTEVRSPVRGVIKSINISTAGGVIMPGEIIMDIVPSDEPLIVEARISPQDIAFLYAGQKARIRLTAYDFAIYGALDATLEQISADTIEGRQGEIFYKVSLRTEKSAIEHNGHRLPILPGMMATADIITGKRTVLDYIVKPILKARQAAMRER